MKEHIPDPDVKRIYEYFLTFLEPGKWLQRKEAIEKYLESLSKPRESRGGMSTFEPVSFNNDQMGWYLYLAETSLYAINMYEPIQGSRVLPAFKRLGEDFHNLLRIKGVKDKVTSLMNVEHCQADSGLFELLVALLYVRNGWTDVELIPEAPPEKRSDIRATKNGEEWFIECKRLSKSSEYSLREREKWLRMWRPLQDFLIDNRLPFVLDFTFHVELDQLPDDFLQVELAGKLLLLSPPCSFISNNTFDAGVKLVDFHAARTHLRKFYVKNPSDQLSELVAGRRDPNRGFTYAVLGTHVRIGEGQGNNKFLDTMDFAVGAFWHCDAVRSIERKARDIRGHLAQAVEQLPENEQGVVHIGLETLDGPLVEVERYERIVNTVYSFDSKGKNLRWVYCHLFQSFAPPDQNWVVDETVYYFGNKRYLSQAPLSHLLALGSVEESNEGVHWMKEPP